MNALTNLIPNENLTALDGTPIDNKRFENKAILFVNGASRCGFTKQYAGLQKLSEEYESKGLVVVGVPCNQFGAQEPGSPNEIQQFCNLTYGITFPLLTKQDVNGSNRSVLYQKLISSEVGGGKNVRWNFEKFLVDNQGNVVKRYASGVTPQDISSDVNKLL